MAGNYFSNLFKRTTTSKPLQSRSVAPLKDFSWWTDWIRQFTGGSDYGIPVSERSALGVTAVWSAVNLISNTTASLPFGIFEKDAAGMRTHLAGHPANRLLNVAPNRLMTPFSFKYAIQARALLSGNGWGYIVRDGQGTPQEIIPLSCDVRLEAVNGNSYAIFKVENIEKVVPYFDMFHIMGMTLDGLTGLSVIKYHDSTIGASLATSQYSKQTSEKGSSVKSYISTEKVLGDDAMESLRSSWKQNYSGPNGYDTAFLDNGMKLYPISMSMADLQIIERSKFSISDIARIFQVPPHKIGDLDRSTNNNIEHQGIEFVQDGVLPWTVRWENEIAKKLIATSAVNTYPKFNLNGLMRGDTTARAAFYRSMTEIGAYSPNRVLELEDENGFEGGEIRTIQMNRIPLDQLPAFVQSQIDSKTALSNVVQT